MWWQEFDRTFVIPVVLGFAFLVLGWAISLPGIEPPSWSRIAVFWVGIGCLALGAYRAMQTSCLVGGQTGGAGGNAKVSGTESAAKGGDGGRGRGGQGGLGGSAEVVGDRSTAIGGRGGDAG